MKQILQSLANGETQVADVPVPRVRRGGMLVKSRCSLISAGTERMLVEFGKSSYLDKARQQPDKVRMVMEKVRTDGLVATVDAVRSKLDQPLALGYSNVGIVSEVGAGVEGFSAGDRVVSNGPHAEWVVVPQLLTARIPDGVSDEAAAFTVVGAIGLQGVRLANPTLGERVVVMGLGLIGLMTVQLLRSSGCSVLGIDFDARKCDLARSWGAEAVVLGEGVDPVDHAMRFSRGVGVDAVLITASTKSSDPVRQAARMSRKRGRIVLVGVTGLELSRDDFYEKELSFQVSCSYGPGRYDPAYEEQGHDYPLGFVRWTEQRNFEAVLGLMADGRIDTKPLASHTFTIDQGVEAYAALVEDKSALGILLSYPQGETESVPERLVRLAPERNYAADTPVVAMVGAGNYASRTMVPVLKKVGAQMRTIVSSGGVTATHHGKKSGFEIAATDYDAVLADQAINTVLIATRHDTHAPMTLAAIRAGKHVFVEKPLAIEMSEIDEIEAAAGDAGRHVMVGFNRRFAPLIVELKRLLDQVAQPKSFIMTMNAGEIPPDSWLQDPKVGGGRIIGEACHYVDLMRFLCGAEIVSVQARRMGAVAGVATPEDKAAIVLGFADGSFGAIHYLANGGRAFAKERIEAFAGNAVLQLDNFRKLTGFGWNGFKSKSALQQDKGHAACLTAFLEAVGKGGPAPIPFADVIEVSRATIEAAQQLRAQKR